LSNERILYGSLSTFDDVYTQSVKDFFQRYFEAIPVKDDERARELSPFKNKEGKGILKQVKAPNDPAHDSKKYLFV
jgi:hypothetical protein